MKLENLQIEQLKLCPECTDKLSKAFGMKKAELQNGGMKEIIWKIQLAEITMKEAGVQFDQKLLVGEAFRTVNEAWTNKLLEEKDDKIRELEMAIEKTKVETRKLAEAEIKKEFGEKLKDYEKVKEDMIKKDSLIEKLSSKIDEYEAKERLQPVAKGNKLEDIVADALKRAFSGDEIVLERKGKNEIDVKQTIRENKKPLGKILVECKNTKKWNNKWVGEIQQHGERENTEFLVIVSNALPNEKWISPLGLEKDGVLITNPERISWAVAFMRLAIVRTADAIRKLEDERERLSKQKEIKEKLLRTISNKDFEKIFSACNEIQEEAQSIRNVVSIAKNNIDTSANSIDTLVKTIFNTNTTLSEAFDDLLK